MFKEIIGYFRHRFAYTTVVNQLSKLSDRELADIGISRGDIRAVALKATENQRGPKHAQETLAQVAANA